MPQVSVRSCFMSRFEGNYMQNSIQKIVMFNECYCICRGEEVTPKTKIKALCIIGSRFMLGTLEFH